MLILITYLIFGNFIFKCIKDLINKEILMIIFEGLEKIKFLSFTRKNEVRNCLNISDNPILFVIVIASIFLILI